MSFQQRKITNTTHNTTSTPIHAPVSSTNFPPVYHGLAEDVTALPNFATNSSEDPMSRSSSTNSSIGDEGAAVHAASYASTPMKKRGSNISLSRLPHGPIPTDSQPLANLPPVSSISSIDYLCLAADEVQTIAAPPSSPTTTTNSSGRTLAVPVRAFRWEPYNPVVPTLRCHRLEEKILQEKRLKELDDVEADLQWLHYQEQAEVTHVAPPPSPVPGGETLACHRQGTRRPRSTTAPSTTPTTAENTATEKFTEVEFMPELVRRKALFKEDVGRSYFDFKERGWHSEEFKRARREIQRQGKKNIEWSNVYYLKTRRQSQVILSSKRFNRSMPEGFTFDESALDWENYCRYTAKSEKDVPAPGDIMVCTIPGFHSSGMQLVVEETLRLPSWFTPSKGFRYCDRNVEQSPEEEESNSEIVELIKALPGRLSRLEHEDTAPHRCDLDEREIAFNSVVELSLQLLELVDVEIFTPTNASKKNKEATIFYREKANAPEILKSNWSLFRRHFYLPSVPTSRGVVVNTQSICIHINKLIMRSLGKFVAIRFVHIGNPVSKSFS